MKLNSFIKQHLTNIFTAQMQKIIAKHKPKIVAVAGSVGKTTTKLAIATVLSQGFRVQYQYGNYNTPISIPFIFTGQAMPSLYNPVSWFRAWIKGQKVLKKPYPYDVVVVELGVDAPGDMAIFKKILHPNIAVLTAVCDEHMEFFKTIDAVAKEEILIASFSDVLVINMDDIDKDLYHKYSPDGLSVRSYGSKSLLYKIVARRTPKNNFRIDIEMSKGKLKDIEVDLIAEQGLKTVAASVAVADILGMSLKEVKDGIAQIKTPSGRMQLLRGINNSTIIDDSYNSSPLAAEAALKTLYDIDAPQRIAILGMMNELGKTSQTAHQVLGKLCNPSKLDIVITIGKDANNFLAPTAESAGCRVIKCNDPFQAANAVQRELKDGAVILAKGSQNGVFAEEAIKPLLADPDDAKKLVRQSSFWLKKKHIQFKEAV